MPAFDLASYVDVQARINRFWTEHPDGRIATNLMSPPDDFTQCRYVAHVYRNAADANPVASGWAFEVAGGTGANRTSHEENCETSAIGRALANLGYATTREDRPSRQEMAKVERGPMPPPAPSPNGNGTDPNRITEKQINMINRLMREQQLSSEEVRQVSVAKTGKADSLQLTKHEASRVIDALIAMKPPEQDEMEVDLPVPAGEAGADRFTR